MRKKAAKEKKEEVSEEEIVEEMEVEESSEIEIPKVQEAASISAPEFSITKIESFEEFENIDVTPFQPESIDVAQASTSFAKKEQAPKGHKRSCCIRGCQTVYRVGTQFFHFPTDQEILLQWLDVIAPEQNDDWEPNSESFVCEYHFREVRKFFTVYLFAQLLVFQFSPFYSVIIHLLKYSNEGTRNLKN